MDKLKKCMTIMAIAGTVLVTGVFCYLPFREMIKEAKKNTVSLEQEARVSAAVQSMSTASASARIFFMMSSG